MIKSIFPDFVRPGYWGSRFLRELIQKSQFTNGIFTNMQYVSESVCGSIAPKYLGLYEIELVPIFKKLFSLPIHTIIDVGAAEGYYAVGLALKFPYARVIAFEATEEGRHLLNQVILKNKVSEQIEVRGYCTPESLKVETSNCSNCDYNLLVMDVEGVEEELLSLHEPSDLVNFYMLIELHDWDDPQMGDRLMNKFSSTHKVQVIEARSRKFSDLKVPSFFPLRLYLSPSLLAFSHERPLPMRWIYFEPA